jgi:hypothetical protein
VRKLVNFRLGGDSLAVLERWACVDVSKTRIVEEALRLYHEHKLTLERYKDARKEPALQQSSGVSVSSVANNIVKQGGKAQPETIENVCQVGAGVLGLRPRTPAQGEPVKEAAGV